MRIAKHKKPISVRHLFMMLFGSLVSIFLLTACASEASSDVTGGSIMGGESDGTTGEIMRNINIQVGDKIFTTTLYDNPAAKAFIERMPMTVNMGDMNANEKYYYLSGSLPTQSASAGQINTGDLMLYGNNCLVLFYKTFSSSYSYTRLGRIENSSGLSAALGNGSVTVSFSLKE